jgi:hypothetical protein
MHVNERLDKLHRMTWPCLMGYYFMGNTLWSSLFYAVAIGSKMPAEWPTQPCMHGGHNHTTLLAAWATKGKTWSGCFMMIASLCTSGHQCCPEVLARMRKSYQEWVRTRIGHIVLSYDGMIIIYHVLISILHCILPC